MRFLIILGLLTALVSALTFANIPSLGFEFLESPLAQVKAQLAKQAVMLDACRAKLTGGPQFKTNGAEYGINGLSQHLRQGPEPRR